jgi:hypothetical protein
MVSGPVFLGVNILLSGHVSGHGVRTGVPPEFPSGYPDTLPGPRNLMAAAEGDSPGKMYVRYRKGSGPPVSVLTGGSRISWR